MNDKNIIINSIFFPRKSMQKKDSKDHIVAVDKNEQIGIRFFLRNSSYDNIVFFHGNAEIAQEYEDIAEIYNQHELNLIVADYRGYGLSSGTPNKDNLLYDALSSFDYISNHLKKIDYNEKIVVMGRSLGSASAFEVASNRKEVDACIIESGFATEYDLLKLMGISPDEINFKLEDGFGSLEKIKKITLPLLVIHADRDNIVPIDQAKLIYDSAISENKQIFIVEGAGHNNIIHTIKHDYFELIKSFVTNI